MRKQEREEVEGQGKGMTAIRVGSPEHFLEEGAFEQSLEDACGRVRVWGWERLI